MSTIRAKIVSNGLNDDFIGQEVEVIAGSITSFFRDEDGSVVLFCIDGKQLRTTLNYSSVKEMLS